MVLTSKVLYQLGDNIDTDLISPSKYMTAFTPEYLATICLRDAYPDFREQVAPGGIVIGGVNFGCGSSRETAPISMKETGTKVVIAEEFARIFYRSAMNIGLPCIVCKGITQAAGVGDELQIDFLTGEIRNLTTGKTLQGTPIPAELLELFEAGGLISYLKTKIAAGNGAQE